MKGVLVERHGRRAVVLTQGGLFCEVWLDAGQGARPGQEAEGWLLPRPAAWLWRLAARRPAAAAALAMVALLAGGLAVAAALAEGLPWEAPQAARAPQAQAVVAGTADSAAGTAPPRREGPSWPSGWTWWPGTAALGGSPPAAAWPPRGQAWPAAGPAVVPAAPGRGALRRLAPAGLHPRR
ncbi:MAG TPA: hypothetical protein VIL11_06060 [Limnochordales bacterium]